MKTVNPLFNVAGDFDRTAELDPGIVEAARAQHTILWVLLTPLPEGSEPVDITVPFNLLLNALSEIAEAHTDAVRVVDRKLLCLFDDAHTAMDVAGEMIASVHDDKVGVRVGLHTGLVTDLTGEFGGPAVDAAQALTRRAHAGWIVATRPVYDKLPPEKQLKLYSLDHVALGERQPPVELLKLSEDSDYLNTATPATNWGPYSRMIITVGGKQRALQAQSEPLTIGRGKNNRLRFDDSFVSVSHARIEYRDGEFVLFDDSTNGTYVRAHGEPHFKAPSALKLRKPGTMWFGRPPLDPKAHSIRYFFE